MLSAYGTFEIGIENYAISETRKETRVETQVRPKDQPTSDRVEIGSQDRTPTPLPSDEQLFAEALAEKLGQPADQMGINFAEITSQHAMSGVNNGYFLAVHQGDICSFTNYEN